MTGSADRPVVLGMCNPHSDDPALALHPTAFSNSAGSRLFQMVRDVDRSVTVAPYLEALDLRNLVLESEWSIQRARHEAAKARSELAGRRVVVLGSTLPGVLGLDRGPVTWYRWRTEAGLDYCVVPHPSGLSRVYNDPEMRRLTGELLAGLIRERRS